jgi:hypothetical protein
MRHSRKSASRRFDGDKLGIADENAQLALGVDLCAMTGGSQRVEDVRSG